MKKNILTVLGLMMAVLAVGGLQKLARAADDAAGDGSEKHFPWDNGPETIDVSAYPKEMQENYKVFAEKCAKCHTLARPINSPYALPEEWKPYVQKMRHKKRSGIDDDSAKAITDFLIYDSAIRKKDLIEKKKKTGEVLDPNRPRADDSSDKKADKAADAPAPAEKK